MAKAKPRTTAHSAPAKRNTFTDPIMDGMRNIGKALDGQKKRDVKFLLDWAKSRFLDGDEEEAK